MRKLSGLLGILAISALSASANAQTADTASAKTVQPAQPTTEEALQNLQKAAADLSKAIEVTVARVASSPELKTAALQVAAGAVSVAQQSLSDHLKMIETALNAAARQIAAAQVANAKKAPTIGQTPDK